MTSVVVRLHTGAIQTLLTGPDSDVARDLKRRGNRVLNRAKQLCPVDTGTLRSSLTQEMLTIRGAPATRIGTNVFYARYVHDGTRYMRGRPFLADALTAAR